VPFILRFLHSAAPHLFYHANILAALVEHQPEEFRSPRLVDEFRGEAPLSQSDVINPRYTTMFGVSGIFSAGEAKALFVTQR
jgi:hypothetical protein